MTFEYKEEYKYLSSACLNITDDCVLNCTYCFVEQHPHYMTLDTAKAAVDYLLNNLHIKKEKKLHSESDKTFINYFGGEPTMLWDEIIVPLTLYIEEKYPNEVKLGITTNGTLLTKERIDFLYDHKINPLLSIDGAKETQDINRPYRNGDSSFDKIIEIIPYLLEKFPNITFRATISQNTVSHTFENYIFASYLGFQNIFMIPNSREEWTEENINILKEQLEKIYIYIGQSFDEGFVPISMQNINESFEWVLQHDINTIQQKDDSVNCRTCLRCGLGTTSGSIGYDGSIYGCQEQDSKDKKNIFYIGNIFKNGIEEDKHTELLKKYATNELLISSNKELCNNCSLRNICSIFACPSTCWDMYNTFFMSSEIMCKWRQFLFFNAKVLMHYLVEKDNKLFKMYLDKDCHFEKYFPKEEVKEENGG